MMVEEDIFHIFELYIESGNTSVEKKKRTADTEKLKEYLSRITQDQLDNESFMSSDLVPYIVRKTAEKTTSAKNAYIERMHDFAHICEKELANTPYACSFKDFEFPYSRIDVDDHESRNVLIQKILAWQELNEITPETDAYFSPYYDSSTDLPEESPMNLREQDRINDLSEFNWASKDTIRHDLSSNQKDLGQEGIHNFPADSGTFDLNLTLSLGELIEMFWAFDLRMNTETEKQYLQSVVLKIGDTLDKYQRERIFLRLPGFIRVIITEHEEENSIR